MAVTTIPWGDGSGDNIYLEYSASQGDQTVLVSSDANNGAARQKVITFLTTVGNVSRSLTVSQEEGASLVSITWNNVCITYGDTAIGYQDTSPQYVQDGLVFWLDGIDKGEGADTWVEKKNGYVFTNHGAVFNPDHVYLDGTAYLDNATATGALSADGTIEVVFKKEQVNGVAFAPAYGTGSYLGFGYASNFLIWSSRSTNRARYSNPVAAMSASISTERALGNGVALTGGGTANLGVANNDPAYVGKRSAGNESTGQYFKGEIYCIRIYNRQLTEAEVIANYAVDCQRFSLCNGWDEYITFQDSTVEQICVSTWGDGTGLTKGKANMIPASEVVTAFSGNTEIEYFNEFRYFGFSHFTANSEVNMFKDCTALKELTLPDNMFGRVGSNMIQNDTLLATLNLGNGRPSFYQGTSPQLNYVINVKIKGIDQYIDLWRENTTFGWGQVWARYESTGAHLIDASTNTEITSVNFPSGRTVVPWTCFNNMKSITSITLPSSVTEIKGYAFYGCSGLTGTVTIPSSVTSIGGTSFSGCTAITNLTIEAAITIASNIGGTSAEGTIGNGTGTFHHYGSMTNNSNYMLNFRRIIIDGDFSNTGTYVLRYLVVNSTATFEVMKIGGNYSAAGTSALNCRPIQGNTNPTAAGQKYSFLEIMGTITSGYCILGSDNATSLADGFILHLGYDVVANNAFPCTPDIAGASFTRLAKIYVGDGSSASHDNAILTQYTSDANWSAYTSKLDTWYNYINDPNANPDFIN